MGWEFMGAQKNAYIVPGTTDIGVCDFESHETWVYTPGLDLRPAIALANGMNRDFAKEAEEIAQTDSSKQADHEEV